MKYLVVFLFTFGFFIPTNSYAQVGGEGVTSFQKDAEAWRRKDDEKINILQTIQDSVGRSGINNIIGAEQAYCYLVDGVVPGYDGYTINNTAVKSYCGTLDNEARAIIISSLLVSEETISTRLEQCAIRPKVMFRFIKGVDYTDVLISSPCYSFTIFYGGKMKTYNFSKGAETIKELVEIFDSEGASSFVSPALLDQMMPIGVPQTKEEEKKVGKSKSTAPVKNWDTQTEAKSSTGGAKGGWNSLGN